MKHMVKLLKYFLLFTFIFSFPVKAENINNVIINGNKEFQMKP